MEEVVVVVNKYPLKGLQDIEDELRKGIHEILPYDGINYPISVRFKSRFDIGPSRRENLGTENVSVTPRRALCITHRHHGLTTNDIQYINLALQPSNIYPRILDVHFDNTCTDKRAMTFISNWICHPNSSVTKLIIEHASVDQLIELFSNKKQKYSKCFRKIVIKNSYQALEELLTRDVEEDLKLSVPFSINTISIENDDGGHSLANELRRCKLLYKALKTPYNLWIEYKSYGSAAIILPRPNMWTYLKNFQVPDTNLHIQNFFIALIHLSTFKWTEYAQKIFFKIMPNITLAMFTRGNLSVQKSIHRYIHYASTFMQHSPLSINTQFGTFKTTDEWEDTLFCRRARWCCIRSAIVSEDFSALLVK